MRTLCAQARERQGGSSTIRGLVNWPGCALLGNPRGGGGGTHRGAERLDACGLVACLSVSPGKDVDD